MTLTADLHTTITWENYLDTLFDLCTNLHAIHEQRPAIIRLFFDCSFFPISLQPQVSYIFITAKFLYTTFGFIHCIIYVYSLLLHSGGYFPTFSRRSFLSSLFLLLRLFFFLQKSGRDGTTSKLATSSVHQKGMGREGKGWGGGDKGYVYRLL